MQMDTSYWDVIFCSDPISESEFQESDNLDVRKVTKLFTVEIYMDEVY